MPHPLSRRIAQVLELQPAASAVEYNGNWLSWDQIGEAARRVAAITAQQRAGLLVRNRPEQLAALLGVLLGGGCAVVFNPDRGDDRTRTEITGLRLPAIIGSPGDLAALGDAAPGTARVSLPDIAQAPLVTPRADGTVDPGQPGVAVWMLTSGTTGPPKRVDLRYDMLAHSVLSGDPPTRLRRGVAIVNSPLVHIGGVFRVLQCVAEARPFVLLEKFELDRWADAVRRHRPGAVSLVPAALRAVLHSGLTRADLAGIRAVTSGTAPLSADDADAFTDKYGIPVLTSYAATEFGGGVAGWTLADHRMYWRAKRGSVGRASLGARLRVVDDDGIPLPAGGIGLLEVKPGQLGPAVGWLRTTDLARIDADGFLWILGRADQAIIRGGFKVLPDDVRSALETHPAVRGAAVIGQPDERLGATPVAMVELRDSTAADAATLTAYLRTKLARYEIPTRILVVDAIPRTPSGKADLGAVRAQLATDAR